ncbi:MAG TPA: SDR family oxidoreductase, partial [Pirellulaceae bacterium]|nr:SDR family oxidoreductase [Pirellulaceae bacterium]
AGRRVAVLARPSRKETAEQRIEAIMQMWESELGRLLPRPICLEGDICSERLGLDERSLRWVADYCSTMLHSAASLTFHSDGTGEPYRSNVGGTKNMLGLCQATGIRDLHYVSTAYVCGLRDDLCRESELDVGQGFRNDYERTKLEAETLVRQADFLDQLTVYRPAVISGDSKTGYTNTYHGLYLYLRLMAILVPQQDLDEQGRRYTPIRLPMTGDERRNVVPIDWVSEVITHLLQTPQAHGKTFNLAPAKCLTPREIIDAGYKYFNSTGVQYVGDEAIDPTTYNRFEAEFLPSIGMYDNYKATDPTFDCSNLRKYAGHLPCPVIDEEILHQYIRFGEEDRWGKRRQRAAVVEWDVAGELQKLVSPTDPSEQLTNGHTPVALGLEVAGPGGGTWTLRLSGDRIVSLDKGLSANGAKLVRVTSVALAELLGRETTDVVAHFRNHLKNGSSDTSLSWDDLDQGSTSPSDIHATSAD